MVPCVGMGTGMGMAVPLWAWLRADSAIHAPAPRSRAKALRSTLRIASVASGDPQRVLEIRKGWESVCYGGLNNLIEKAIN